MQNSYDCIIITAMALKLTPNQIISTLFTSNKGILAADESIKSANKRFSELGIAQSKDKRKEWRELLLQTPNFAQYISGVILYDETIRQKVSDGKKFTDLLIELGVLIGIKVDEGLVPLPFFEPETITEGLDGLAARLEEYKSMGASFTKWRSAFSIDSEKHLPTSVAVHANLNSMARYAAITQQLGMVPIVEPEVLYDGTHSLKESVATTENVLRILFDLLIAYKVDLNSVILKTSMVLAGSKYNSPTPTDEVATSTLRVLSQRVPDEVGGIVFLSGGQSPVQATKNFNSICKIAKNPPWPITFSFSRAVQQEAMKTWAGSPQNAKKAQEIFTERLKQNVLARSGHFE